MSYIVQLLLDSTAGIYIAKTCYQHADIDSIDITDIKLDQLLQHANIIPIDLSIRLSDIIVITAIIIIPSAAIIIIPSISIPAIDANMYSSGTHDIDIGGSNSNSAITISAVYAQADIPLLRRSRDPDAVYIVPMLKKSIVADIECAENRQSVGSAANISVIPASIILFICSTENSAPARLRSTADITSTSGIYTDTNAAGPSKIHASADIEPSNTINRIISEYFRISTARRIEPDDVASTCASGNQNHVG